MLKLTAAFAVLLFQIISCESLASVQCVDLIGPSAREMNLRYSSHLSQGLLTHMRSRLRSSGRDWSSYKGYVVLAGIMVGSAAITSQLGSQLPQSMQFATIFISQLGAIGLYALGAPILEPLTSRFRKWAFGMNDNSEGDFSTDPLEATWRRTQNHYSLNAQMSRNIISQFILSVKQNFYYAYRAMEESNPEYSADQIAEAAFRMRLLFKDIEPDDLSVAIAVRATFTRHITVDRAFIELVQEKASDLDPDSSLPVVRSYYDELFTAWFDQ